MGLAVAMAARIGLVVWVSVHPQQAMTPDSQLYLDLGHHFFEAYVENRPEYLWASLWRTPGYPAFARLCGGGAEPQIPVIVAGQCLLSLMCLWLTYAATRRVFSRRAAILGTAALALDPLTIIYTGYIRNEILFTMLLVAAILCLFTGMRGERVSAFSAAGALVALAALTRPVALYLPLALAPAIGASPRLNGRRRTREAVVFVTAFAVLVGGWMVRNLWLTGYATLSTIDGTNILYYRAIGAIAEESGRSRRALELEMQGRMAELFPDGANPGLVNQYQKREGLRLLLQHPRGAAASSMKGLFRLLLGPGYGTWVRLLPAESVPSWVPEAISVWQLVWLAIVLSAALLGAVWCYRRQRVVFWVLAPTLLYFLAISAGPEAYSRFRVPLMPLFCLLAGVGLDAALHRFRRFRIE
jgi:4-amino-4-deoxy-L-arabinose transferase-like glycosyltransferase